MKRDSKSEVYKKRDVNNKKDRAVARRKSLQNNHRNMARNQKEKAKGITNLIVTTQGAIMKQIKKAKTRI
jgi:cell division protein FtsL